MHSLFLSTDVTAIRRDDDQVCASLSLMEAIKVKWLKGFLFASCLFFVTLKCLLHFTSLMFFLSAHLLINTRASFLSVVLRDFETIFSTVHVLCISDLVKLRGPLCSLNVVTSHQNRSLDFIHCWSKNTEFGLEAVKWTKRHTNVIFLLTLYIPCGSTRCYCNVLHL